MLRIIILISIFLLNVPNVFASSEQDRDIYNNKFIILVSFSMSESALDNIFKEATNNDVIIIFKGFKNNNIKEHLQALMDYRSQYPLVPIKIDPDIFDKSKTSAVPTYIFVSSYQDINMNKVTGFVGLEYFKNKLKEEGVI